MGPGLDDLGISVRGVGSPRAAANLLDGPVDQSDAAAQQPDPTSVAAGAGEPQPAGPSAGNPQDVGASAANTATPQGRGRVIDVSEGTPLDPLLNKTYDLNYAKSVPSAADMK